MTAALSRRDALAGGGLLVAFSCRAAGAAARLPGDLEKSPLLDSWLRIGADGRVTVFTGKAELGQGIATALIQVAAEELDLRPTDITLVTADTARTPDEGFTAGSHSMQDSGTAILNAAAQARALLVRQAAAQLGEDAAGLVTRDGAVVAKDGRRLGYAALAAGLSLDVEASAASPLKPPGRFTVIGRSLPRVDLPAKLAGGAAYVQDMRLPGMLHARVARGPSPGTRLRAPDLRGAGAMPGVVRLVRAGEFLAVVATGEWQAVAALRALTAPGWEADGTPAGGTPIDDPAGLPGLPARDLVILDRAGAAAADGARQFSARYTRPWLMHGAIGPSCAVAWFRDGEMTVWTHSQGVYPLRAAIAKLLRLPAARVRCIQVEGAGCYGQNGADDAAADAAVVAHAMPGRPIRMQWMREQEHGWEPLGPGMLGAVRAALGPDGRIASWEYEVWSNTHSRRPGGPGVLLAGAEMDPPFPAPPPRPIPMPEGGGDRNAIPIYTLPRAHCTYHFIAAMPHRISALRSLGAHLNVFAIESFMDELAQAAGSDPVAFRLAHLDDARARDAVTLAAGRFGWSARRRRADRGFGFAFARYKNLGAYCAIAMEIEVARETGALHLLRVVAAVDSGQAVNPDGIRNQIEGGIVQATSWTLQEQVGFAAGRRTSFDWSAYPILRFADTPGRVEVHVIDRPGAPFLGTGEAAQGPTSAAIGNALADALGRRVRDLPISAARVREAASL